MRPILLVIGTVNPARKYIIYKDCETRYHRRIQWIHARLAQLRNDLHTWKQGDLLEDDHFALTIGKDHSEPACHVSHWHWYQASHPGTRKGTLDTYVFAQFGLELSKLSSSTLHMSKRDETPHRRLWRAIDIIFFISLINMDMEHIDTGCGSPTLPLVGIHT